MRSYLERFRSLTLLVVGGLVVGALAATRAAHSESTPVGPLPVGPVTETNTAPGLLVAIALPHSHRNSGLIWRIARNYDPAVINEVSEADLGSNVVLVFRVVGPGDTALVFALTGGDASSKALRTVTAEVHSAKRP
jgi:hypothetical protein